MILPIRAYGDPILHEQSSLVTENSKSIQKLINNMILTMRHAEGAGLAAPQVGKSLSIFVADLSGAIQSLPKNKRPNISDQPMVFINPEITFSSLTKEEFEEGCLSIPNLPLKIRRPDKVKLRYLDLNFNLSEIIGAGTVASVLQHENDHLNGVLHIDYLSKFRRKLIEGRLNQIKSGNFEAAYPMQIGERI